MALQEPKSIEECVYFTNRTMRNGKVMALVFRQNCPKCGKALMGKPRDKKDKILIRAKEYVCPACGYRAEKQEYEESLQASVKYTCPHCGFVGETEVPFKRKKIEGMDTLRLKCGKCGGNIDITKKLREGKCDKDL